MIGNQIFALRQVDELEHSTETGTSLNKTIHVLNWFSRRGSSIRLLRTVIDRDIRPIHAIPNK